MADAYGIDPTDFAEDREPIIVTDEMIYNAGTSTELDTGRSGRGQPSFGQLGKQLVIVDGFNRNVKYDGDELVPLSLERPRILSYGEAIGADYDKDDATYKFFIQLDDDALFANDRLIGAMITLTNGTNTDNGIIVDSWKAYSGSPYDGKPVVQINAALAYDYLAAETTYKIHRKYTLSATSGGSVAEGEHFVLLAFYDAVREDLSATVEIPPDDDYGDLEFYKITIASPNQTLVISNLPKPPSDSSATHWYVYMTQAGSDEFYFVKKQKIGTWSASSTISFARSDAWIRSRPKRGALRFDAFPTSSVICVAKNRAFIGGSEVVSSPGTLTMTTDSRYFTLTSGALAKQHEGMRIEPEGTSVAYEIRTVLDSAHGILYEPALADKSATGFRIYSWPRHLFPSEIDPNDGRAHPEGTDLYGGALELPISRGAKIIAAALIPGEDILAFSQEECVRITGREVLNTVPAFQEGLESKPSLIAAGELTAGVNQKGVIASQYGSTPVLLSQRIPKQLSSEVIAREHLWRTPALHFTVEGGSAYSVFCVAPVGEDTLGFWLIYSHETGEWTSTLGMAASALGLLTDSDGIVRPVIGDIFGRLWWLFKAQSSSNSSLGARTTYRRGVATGGSAISLIDESAWRTAYPFNIDGDGERGVPISLIAGTGAGQTRYCYMNTTIGILPHKSWDTVPDATTVYQIGATRASGKMTWDDLGRPASKLKDVLYLDFLFNAYAPLYGGDGERVDVQRGSATVTAKGSLTFDVDVVGQPLLVKNDTDHIGWVKTRDSATQLTLVSAWDGDNGATEFSIGAPMLKVNVYKDLDQVNVYKTIYVPMHVPLVSAQLGTRISLLQIEFETYDEAQRDGDPMEIWDIQPRYEVK